MASNQDELNANEPLDGENGTNAAGGSENSGGEFSFEIVQFRVKVKFKIVLFRSSQGESLLIQTLFETRSIH